MATNASKHSMDIEMLISGAVEIELPLNYRYCSTTYTLCSIPSPNDALKEIKRAMKDDVKIIFCEHGKAPDEKILKWQNRINPI